MLNTCFPCGSLEFGSMLVRRCLQDEPPIKTSQISFTGGQHYTCLSQFVAAGIKYILKAWAWFLFCLVVEFCPILLFPLLTLLCILCCNEAQLWIRLYAESCKSCQQIVEPGGPLGASQHNSQFWNGLYSITTAERQKKNEKADPCLLIFMPMYNLLHWVCAWPGNFLLKNEFRQMWWDVTSEIR